MSIKTYCPVKWARVTAWMLNVVNSGAALGYAFRPPCGPAPAWSLTCCFAVAAGYLVYAFWQNGADRWREHPGVSVVYAIETVCLRGTCKIVAQTSSPRTHSTWSER